MLKLNTSCEIKKDRLILREKEELISIWQCSKNKSQLFHHDLYSETFPILTLFLFFNTLHWNILQLLILLQDKIHLGKMKVLLTNHQRRVCTLHTILKFHLKEPTKWVTNTVTHYSYLSFL